MAETETFDVIVLGSGIAGLAAALAAQERGLRPLLLEKSDLIGGTTADSYGLIWVGGNHLMQRAGAADPRDDIVRYMTFLGGGEVTEARVATLVDRAPDVISFFEACGIPFRLIGGMVDHYFGVADGARGPGRTLEADLISGFELGEWRDKVRTPKDAPYFCTAAEQFAWGGINRYSTWDQDLVRDRRAKDMRGKGVGLVTHFVKALLKRGVPIRLGAAVHGLIVEGERVTGVRMADGKALAARRGVVIATGGYEWNAELMADFDPIPRLQPLSPSSSTGDGLIMGAEIGAAIRRIQNNLSLMLGFYLVPDEPGHAPIQCMAGISEMTSPHTIVVNQAGQRFADESYFQSVVPALRRFDTLRHDYANLPCFLIFDEQFAQRYSLAHLPVGAAVPASIARADSVSELAEKLGVNAAGFVRTVERFNGFAAAGVDEDFQRGALRWRLADRSAEGRRNSSLGALDRPPFYGLELRPSLGTTSAGLLTDVNGQVLHQRRHPIEGLYASGVVAARTEIGAGYQAGLNLASAMTFSTLAVEHMKRQ
jgi:3-oxosteroid 1-dehydrogenase